jgi:hypothetical protein
VVKPVASKDGGLALARARGERWLPARRIRSIAQAARFVNAVGFALLFPTERVMAPSLFEAVAGPDAEPWAQGMGPAESMVWRWKDAMPEAHLAWSGRFLHRRGSVLSPRLLAALYPGDGEPDDHRALALSPEAHRIGDALMTGPLTSSALRELIGHRSRYDRAIGELQGRLLVSSAGTQEQLAGWPAVVLELTCRLFAVGSGPDYRYAADRYLETIVEATPAQLAKAYGWTASAAGAALDDLVGCGRAGLTPAGYRTLAR